MTDNKDSALTAVTERVINTVMNTIKEHSLLEDRSSVLVALSGGADSVCLLHVLYQLRSTLGIQLFAAHVNHGIRGAEADGDRLFAEQFCGALDIKCFTRCADVPGLAEKWGCSEEEAGRRVRYDYFAEVCAENDIDAVATAHNKNDRAETVLMRMIRGSGASGLKGIKYEREDGVIRPLLDVIRDEIEAYCAAAGLEFKTDSTNADDSYTRNRVRHRLMPLLESEFNPGIVTALTGLSDSIIDDAEFIDGYAARLYERLRPPLRQGKFRGMHLDSLRMIASRSITTRLIRLCAEETMGGSCSLERKHFKAVLRIIDGTAAAAALPNGLRVRANHGWLEFYKEDNGESLNSYYNNEFCIEVGLNKSYNIEKIGTTVSLMIIDKNALAPRGNDILLDADKLGVTAGSDVRFMLRSRIEGDRIVIYKNGGSKKVKSLMIDKKVPREERDRIPLLCRGGEILAVLGLRVSERYRPGRRTKNYLVVSYERDED